MHSSLALYLATQGLLTLAWIQIGYFHFYAGYSVVQPVELLYTITSYCIKYTSTRYIIVTSIATPALCILYHCTKDAFLTAFAVVVFPALFTFQNDHFSSTIHGLALLGVLVVSTLIGGIFQFVIWAVFIILYIINLVVEWKMPTNPHYLTLDQQIFSSTYFLIMRMVAFSSICFEFLGILVASYYVFKRQGS